MSDTHVEFAGRKSKPWPLFVGLAALVGLIVGFFASSILPDLASSGNSRTSEVIEVVTRQQEVALLSLQIQGIAEESTRGKLLGFMDLPGSERAAFVQYAFKAKLGIDGSDVEIESTGDNTLRVTIPEFIFIGHSDEEFKLAAENNGVLSWMTPEIDHVDMVNRVLNDSTKSEYIEANQEDLQDQTESFYDGIINGVDPSMTVEYRFR